MKRIPRKFECTLYDDFISGGIANFQVGAAGFNADSSSVPNATVASVVAGEAGHPGVIKLTSSYAGGYGDAWISTGGASSSAILTKDIKRAAMVVKGDAKRTGGVFDQLELSVGSPAYQIALDSEDLVTNPDGCWHVAQTLNSVVVSNGTTKVPFVADTWFLLEMEFDYLTKAVRCYINGALVNSLTISNATFWTTPGNVTSYIYTTHATVAYNCQIDEFAVQTTDFLDESPRIPEYSDVTTTISGNTVRVDKNG